MKSTQSPFSSYQVLDKFPIAQHIRFGKLFSFDPVVKTGGDGLFKRPMPVPPVSQSDSGKQGE